MGKGLGFIVTMIEGDERFGLEGSVSSGPFDSQGAVALVVHWNALELLSSVKVGHWLLGK